MNHQEYWAKREEEALKHYITDEKEYEKEINRIYSDMLDSCNEQINAFYGKYADKEGITLAEAKKRVSQLDIAAYERKAKRYVKDKDFSAQANEEMRLYNATMKINRFEMLKANIGLELIKGHDELEKFMSGILKGRTEEELRRQAGILGKTITNNGKAAHAIVNASYKNATFSDRVWMYHDEMKADLSKLLKTGLIQGKNPKALARELEKYVMGDAKGGAKFNAERLMRTELARVQTEAQKQSFERNGFTEYTFLANSGCCGDCQALNGKHFKVADMMPGENAAPLHPFCRCSVAAHSDRKEYDEWLNYLEQGGTTEEYNKQKAAGLLTKNSKKSKMASKFGFKRIKGKHSVDDDIGTRQNPVCNPNFTKGREYQINCQRCCPAYEMRRRGYDVEALPYGKSTDAAYKGWQNIFDNAKWLKIGKNRGNLTRSKIVEDMQTWGNGSRAEIYVQWKAGSAHVFMAENVDGVVRFIDPQTGNTDVSSYFEYIKPTKTLICRLDELEPTDLIKECCK